jgi:hypothetical protein
MSSSDRQNIERVPGARRARLTPAPGTSAEPVPADEVPDEDVADEASGASEGPNDARMRRDVPPHW